MSALTGRGSTRRWRQLRVEVLVRDRERCLIPDAHGRPCGLPATVAGPTAGHVDHVVPRSLAVAGAVTLPDGRRVDVDDPANLRASCPACNLRRGARPDPAGSGPTSRPVSSWSW